MRVRPLLVLVLGAATGSGCSGDHLTREPPAEPAALYWNLELNHHAVTLSLAAPYDTLALTAVPHNARGEVLAGLGVPAYSSPDLGRVQVTPDGVLRAVGLTAEGQPIPVVATLTAGNLKHVDTVLVRVVADTLPKLASLSMHPVPPDSAKIPMGNPFVLPILLPIRAADTDGSVIGDLLVAVRSSDTSTVAIKSFGGRLFAQGQRLGTTTLVASATAFGVTKADTVSYRVGWPIFALIQVQAPGSGGSSVGGFSKPSMRVGAGALIRWDAAISDTADVTFADADTVNVAAADSSTSFWAAFGNIYQRPASLVRLVLCNLSNSSFGGDCDGRGSFVLSPETYQRAYRVFPVPGTYEYHSTRYGGTGRIIVMDER